MASERSHSPLELPPRASGKEQPRSRTEAERAPLVPLLTMPISFGVLLLGMTVTCLLCLLLSGAAYSNASARAEEASRACERRLGKELLQLKEGATRLQTQLDLRAQDIGGQAREIERLSAELKVVRTRTGLDARGAGARRAGGR